MRLSRVRLSNYRNFHRLDLSLGPGASVFIGANAQGKTNLLESVYLLATMKELRAESEAQVIRREAAAGPIPAARGGGGGGAAGGPRGEQRPHRRQDRQDQRRAQAPVRRRRTADRGAVYGRRHRPDLRGAVGEAALSRHNAIAN